MIPAEEIARAKSRIAEVIGADVALRYANGSYVGLCPWHAEKTPSFHVFDRDDGIRGAPHFHCFGCGAHGDVISYIARRRNLDFSAAVRWLLDLPKLDPFSHTTKFRPTPLKRERENASDLVRAILRHSGPITNRSAAFFYLWSRGLDTGQPALLANEELYCHEVGHPLPALVAPITDSGGEVCAVQRIWVAERIETVNGAGPQDARAPLKVRKKTLGPMRDGAVRLAPAGLVLGLCEGVESGIAASMMYRVPVFAVCGAARLATVWIPPEVKHLIIFGDRGSVGEEMAERAVLAHRKRLKRTVEIVLPWGDFGDFAEELIGRK